MLQMFVLISRVLHPQPVNYHFVDDNGHRFQLHASMVEEPSPLRYRFLDDAGKPFELRPPDESLLRASPLVSTR